MFFLVDVCTQTEMKTIMQLVGTLLTIIQIAIPIILIIMGSIDLGKAVFAGKEDEIKKNQQILVKRAIAAVLVFFVATLVTLIMGILPTSITGTSSWNACWTQRNS